MALKQAYAVKTVIGNTDLELKADVGESFRIKDVYILNPTTSYVTFRTEKTTVGYFRVGGDLGSHLPFPKSPTKHSVGFNAQAYAMTSVEYNSVIDAGGNVLDMLFAAETDLAAPAITPRMSSPQQLLPNPWTILKLLSSLGKFTGYPVATGETFKITGAAQATSMQVVIYEIWDGEDVKNTEDNGSKAKNYLFLNYGRPAASITTATSTVYDTVQSPSEFPAFPYNRTVPPKTTIEILGILGSEITIGGATVADYLYSQYLKLVFEREVLFDEDRNGLPHRGLIPPDVALLVSIGEGSSLIGNYSTVDSKMPLMFDTPLSFGEGDELNIYLTTVLAAGGATITAARAEIATIEMVRRAE